MLLQELKKIFRPRLLLAALALGAAFYWLFIDFYVTLYPTNIGGTQGQAVLDVTTGWAEKYGPSLSPQEEAEIESELPSLIAEADGYIAANATAQKYGLETYQDFLDFQEEILHGGDTAPREDERKQDLALILDYLQGDATGNIEGRLNVYDMYPYWYQTFASGWQEGRLAEQLADSIWTQREYDNIMSTYFGSTGSWDSLLPHQIVGYHASDCAGRFTILAVLWLCVLLGPVMTGDRMSRMVPMQYASRRGRGLARIQLGAALLTAAVTALVTAGLYVLLFIVRHRLYVFLPCRLAAFDHHYAWPDWTFGGWLLAVGALHLAVCLAAGAVLWLLSRCSGNYIAMLLKVIPLFAAGTFALPKLMDDAFYYANPVYELLRVPYVEAYAAAALLGLALGLCAWLLSGIRKRDISDA